MTTEELFETIVTIDNRMGLHARPATMLAKLSSGFEAELTLERLGCRLPQCAFLDDARGGAGNQIAPEGVRP